MQRRDSLGIIEVVTELLRDFGYVIGKLWHVGDIHMMCEQQGLARISDAEAMEVFTLTQEKCHAATSSISRPQMEKTLRLYVESRGTPRTVAEEVVMAE